MKLQQARKLYEVEELNKLDGMLEKPNEEEVHYLKKILTRSLRRMEGKWPPKVTKNKDN